MRNTSSGVLVLLALSSFSSLASAQAALELPSPSPKARTEQRVGLTDVAIDYSSPGVKGRKIWGPVVPYDKVWRAGANAPTKLTASRDFGFGGTQVKAGAYSLFITPGKTAWTVMLNTDLNASQDEHDAKKDVATISVKPGALAQLRERLRYTFDDTQDGGTTLALEWERVRIAVPIAVDTQGQVNTAIEKASNDAWQPQFTAASYLFNHNENDRALGLVDRSIAIRSTWRNEWLRAQIQQKKGNKAEAMASVGRAQDLGKGDEVYEKFVRGDLQKTVAGWK
jgi:hypothetical protein